MVELVKKKMYVYQEILFKVSNEIDSCDIIDLWI